MHSILFQIRLILPIEVIWSHIIYQYRERSFPALQICQNIEIRQTTNQTLHERYFSLSVNNYSIYLGWEGWPTNSFQHLSNISKWHTITRTSIVISLQNQELIFFVRLRLLKISPYYLLNNTVLIEKKCYRICLHVCPIVYINFWHLELTHKPTAKNLAISPVEKAIPSFSIIW